MNSLIRTLCSASLLLAVPSVAAAQETGTPAADTTSASGRPGDFSVGIGAGWTFPGAEVLAPNTAAVRLRLGRLTLEPTLNFSGRTSGTEQTGTLTPPGGQPQTNEEKNRSSGSTFGVGANVRYDFLSRGPFDFVGILGVSAATSTDLTQRDVQETTQRNDTRATTSILALNWGGGVVWWLRDNLSVSADVLNPLVAWNVSTKVTDREVPNQVTAHSEQVERTFTYGLVFAPTARVLFHLYF